MPKFHVVETFTLESRQLFVLSGSIVEGEVRSGMFLSESSASGPAKTVRIHSLEFVRRPGGVEDLCLCVECAESEDLDRWRSLDIAGQTREVMADGPH